MAVPKLLLALAASIGLVSAQLSSGYFDSGISFNGLQDPAHGVYYGFVSPPSTATGADAQEFIGEILAPVANKWVGLALGGQMSNNPLIVAWPNAGSIVYSTRWATDYLQPTVYTGPKITTLEQSINSTHWKWIFRCESCTTWSGGALTTNGVSVLAWVIGLTPVTTPANAATNFNEHDDFGFWGQDFASASTSSYKDVLNGVKSSAPSPTSPSQPAPTNPPPTPTPPPPVAPPVQPFDYVVVGGGPGGLVTADRLSQNGKRVLLVERGGPATGQTGGADVPPWAAGTTLTRFDIPGEFQGLFGSTGPTYWFCKDITTFAGCLIGGGTSINGGLYWLPTGSDFSTTAGWPSSWGNQQPYTNSLKQRLPSNDKTSPDGVRYNDETYTIMSKILGGLGFRNLTINDNVDQKEHVYGHSAYNFQNGKRWGPVATYLQSSLQRKNFQLSMYTLATSVARNGSLITGVQTNNTAAFPNGFIPLTKNGRVILSAGSFGTPRILFQSGIGPSDQIALVQQNAQAAPFLPPSKQFINLPVGYNVQDNPSINLMFTHSTIDNYNNWDDIWDKPAQKDIQQYLKNQSGFFAQSSPKLNFWRALSGPDGITRYIQGTARPGYDSVSTSYNFNASQVFSVTMYLSTGTTSRGRIGLTSSALSAGALVNPWFVDPNDKAVLIQGLQELIDAAKKVPGVTLITPDNTTTLTDYVNNYPTSSLGSNHWVGSASIGKVVDENTKVLNTTNLFVVDASIVPSLFMGNPQGAIMSAAEQAVTRILALAGGP